MPILVKDIIEGAELNVRTDSYYGAVYYGTRSFLVKHLTDGSTNQSASALARALETVGLPQLRTNPYPEDLTIAPNASIQNYRVRSIRNSDDAVFLFADFDTPILPSSPAVFTASDDYGLQQVTTSLFPGTWEPLSFSWKDPADPAAQNVTDTATMSFPIPLRKIVLSGWVANRDLDVYRPAFRMVNSDTWRGLPPGYWLFAGMHTERDAAASPLPAVDGGFQVPVDGPINRATLNNSLNNPDARFQSSFQCITKVTEDWRQAEAFRSQHTGKLVTVPKTITDAARAKPYTYGVDANANGLIVVGLFQMTSFTALFGT